MDCIFCSDKIAGQVVCGDELAFCVANIEPLKDGHVMILPRRHVTRLAELTADEAKAVTQLTDQLVDAVEKLTGEAPCIHINHGHHKSQPHLHVHVVPSKGSLRDHFVAHEGVPNRVRQTPEYTKLVIEELNACL